MKHTLLFREGLWLAEGVYTSRENDRFGLEGAAEIRHENGLWIQEITHTILKGNGVSNQNTLEIVPFPDDADFTDWYSQSSALGKLHGRLMVVEDSILSGFVSEDGVYSGVEYYLKVDDNIYQNRGYVWQMDLKLASWSLRFVYKGQTAPYNKTEAS